MNLPNKLSLLRVILIPVMVALFYVTAIPYNYLWSAVVFAVAAFTDFLDGHIARKYNLVTDFGKFIDPIADKMLVLSAFILILTLPNILGGGIGALFGIECNSPEGVGLCVRFGRIAGGVGVIIIVAREMTVSVLRMIAANKGVVLAAEKSGKIKTFTTDIAIFVLLMYGSVQVLPLYFIGLVLYIVSVGLTIYSGAFYLIKNKKLFSESM